MCFPNLIRSCLLGDDLLYTDMYVEPTQLPYAVCLLAHIIYGQYKRSCLDVLNINLDTWFLPAPILTNGASQMSQWWRICLPMQDMQVRSLGQEDPLEEEMATLSNILAWRIPWTERSLVGSSPWGCERVGHNLGTEHTFWDTGL